MMIVPAQRITIIGMGLIGGSLGLALRAAKGKNIEITGADISEDSLTTARLLGAADIVAADSKAAVKDADIVFLCTPVLQAAALAKEIAPYLKQGAIVTDTCSTKNYLMQQIDSLLPDGVHYIPGHPMAGRERSGIEAADAALFENKWYILTPNQAADVRAVDLVRQVISLTGARITVMEAEKHDVCTALISHVPHIGAAALVNLLAYSEDQDSSIKLAGGGFRDTTRIASSNADMWADICITNAEPIVDSLEKLSQLITQVTQAIRAGDRACVHNFFTTAKKRRDELLQLELTANEQLSTNGH